MSRPFVTHRCQMVMLAILLFLAGITQLSAQNYPNCFAARPIFDKNPITVDKVFHNPDSSSITLGCLDNSVENYSARQTYWFVFEALTDGTFEFWTQAKGLNADYDFGLWEEGCPCDPLTKPIACNWQGWGSAKHEYYPTGISSDSLTYIASLLNDPLKARGWIEYEQTVTIKKGKLYYLVLNNINANEVGFTINFGGTAQIGAPSKNIKPSIGSISGATEICTGAQNIEYSVKNTGREYTWTASQGISLNSSGNKVKATFGNQGGKICATDPCYRDTTCITVKTTAAKIKVLSPSTSLCQGDCLDLNTLISLSPSNLKTYFYKDSLSAYKNATANMLSGSEVCSAGTYWVKAEGSSNCYDLAKIILTEKSRAVLEISGGGAYCVGDAVKTTFKFTGTPPFTLIYNNGTSDQTINSSNTSETINSTFATPFDLKIIAFKDANVAACAAEIKGQTKFTLSNTCSTCKAKVGELDITPLNICQFDTLKVNYKGGHTLGSDDALKFVLHDVKNGAFGTLFSVNDSPAFTFQSGMWTNTTYYVSAVVGKKVGNSIDFNDPCLSISKPTPITFIEAPSGEMTVDKTQICVGDSITVTFKLKGTKPFTIRFNDGEKTHTFYNINNGYQVKIKPTQSVLISLISVEDGDAKCVGKAVFKLSINVDDCNCVPSSNLGEMALTPLNICNGTKAIATYKNNKPIAFNETLLFVLHDSPSNKLGKTIMVNTKPEFDFISTLQEGKTYYISAVIAPNTGSQQSILASKCLAVAPGTPITWLGAETADFTLGEAVCEGKQGSIIFTHSGKAPFEIEYFDGIKNRILKNDNSNKTSDTLSFYANKTIKLIAVKDGNSCSAKLLKTNQNPQTFAKPIIKDLKTTCEKGFYTVTFSVETTLKVSVSGSEGGTLDNFNRFVSNKIAIGKQYTFDVKSDACDAVEVKGWDTCSCTSDMSANIEVLKTPSCADSKDAAIKVTVNGATAQSYEWNTGEKSNALTNIPAGTYNVSVVVSENCTLKQNISLTAPKAITANLSLTQPKCNEKIGSVSLKDISGGNGNYVYQLNALKATANPIFNNLAEGKYTIQIKDEKGCTWSDAFEIKADEKLILEPLKDTTIQLGTMINFELKANKNLKEIIWTPDDGSLSCDNCEKVSIKPMKNTLYKVLAIDERGCQAQENATVKVLKVRKVFIPTAFSPNDDKQNDLFMPYLGDDVQLVNSMRIFDRWGTLIFESNGTNEGESMTWNGRLGNEPLPSGAYIYWIEVTFIDGQREAFKGEVSLFR